MKYCVDTWFLLLLANKDEKAERILRETETGKTTLIIPSIVLSEFTKKYFAKGKKISDVEGFIKKFQINPKIDIIHTTDEIALETGKISFSFGIPMIDSIIASVAKIMKCNSLLSDDDHFINFCKKNKIKLSKW